MSQPLSTALAAALTYAPLKEDELVLVRKDELPVPVASFRALVKVAQAAQEAHGALGGPVSMADVGRAKYGLRDALDQLEAQVAGGGL